MTGESFPSYSDYYTYLGKLYADSLKAVSEGNQLMTTTDKLGEEGLLEVTYLASLGDMYFGFDLAQAEGIWGANLDQIRPYVWANGRTGKIRLWTNNPDCGLIPVCGRWEPYNSTLVRWQPGDKMRVTTLGDVTRTYPNKVAGWLRVEWTTYAFFGSTHATSVRVNGVSVYPSSGKTLPHLWDVRRRRQQSQDFWRTLDAQPFSVELEVGAGDLDVSFGSDVVRSFSVAVTTNPAPKDQTFTSRVYPGGNGCGKVDDQYWTCAGEGPELLTAAFTGDAIIRFKMRMKDNDIHSAAAIILRHTSTEQSLLFLDASASKPTLAVEGYMFGGPTKVVGDSPIRAAVWHDYEVGRVEGAFYVWMDNKMLLHWKDSKVDHGTDCSFLIRPWRSIIDVKDIKYETVRNTITVLGTTHPQGNAGKYFNFDRDDLALPEGKSIGSGYVEGEFWRGRRVGAKEGTTYLHCRGGASRGRKRLQLWTFNGLDDGDSHGRREDDAKDGDFQKGDKLTTARWCGLAV